MPFLTAEQDAQRATGIFPELRTVRQPDPSFGDILGAAFRRHNIIASGSMWMAHQSELRHDVVSGYNPLVDEDLTGLEQYLDAFSDVHSHYDYMLVRQKIERELRDVEILDRAGFMGLAASLGASVLDPIMFIPVGGWAAKTASASRIAADLTGATARMTASAARRYAVEYAAQQLPRISRYAAETALVGGGITAASELALYYTQRTRTSEQVLTTIAAGTILSGMIGAGIGAVSRRRFSRMVEEFADNLKEAPPPTRPDPIIQLELADTSGKPLVGQELRKAEQQMFFEDTPITSTVRMDGTQVARIAASRQEAGEVANIIRMIDSMLDAEAKRQLKKEAPKAASAWDRIAYGAAREGDLAELARGGEVLAKPLAFLAPAMRLMTHPLVEVRKIAQMLRPSVFLTKGNLKSLANGDNSYTAAESYLARAASGINRVHKEFYPAYVKRMKSIGQRPMSLSEFNEQIGRAMVRQDTHEILEVARAAKAGRDLTFGYAFNEAKAVGLITETDEQVLLKGARSYFPRYPKEAKLRTDAGRRAFVDDMSAAIRRVNEGMSVGQSRVHAREYLNHYANNIHIGDPHAGHARYLKERMVAFDDTMMDEWFERNYEEMSKRFMHAVGPDIELARRFGSVEMTDIMKGLKARMDLWIAEEGLSPREIARRKRLANAAVRDIEHMRDEIRHTAGLPKDVTAVGPRVLRGIRQLSHHRVGLFVGLASLVDPAYIVQSTSLLSTMRSFWARFGAGIDPAIKAMTRQELELMDQSLELVLHGMTKERFGVVESTLPIAGIERLMNAGTHAINWASGAIPWNHTMRQWSGLSSIDYILRESANLVRGRVSSVNRAKLARVGVDEAWAKKFVDQFTEHGVTMPGGMRLSNTMAWIDTAAAQRLRRAVSMSSDMGVMKPLPGDRAIWMTSPVGQVLSQYMSFGMAATSRIALAGLQQRDFNTAVAFLMAVGIGGVITSVKRRLSDRPAPESLAVFATEAIDRSGFTGTFFEFDEFISNASFGKIGVSAWTGRWGNRYFSPADMLQGAWGPSGDTIETLLTATGWPLGISPDKAGARAFRRVWPFQQLQQFANIWKKVDERRID